MPKTVNFEKITVTVTTAGTQVPIMSSGVNRYVKSFSVYAPTGNTGTNIYLGNSSVDNTWIPIAKGAINSKTLDAESITEGFMYDLTKIYIDADSNGDTAIVVYELIVDSAD